MPASKPTLVLEINSKSTLDNLVPWNRLALTRYSIQDLNIRESICFTTLGATKFRPFIKLKNDYC